MLSFNQITFQRGTKVLFDAATAVIFHQQKVGVVGKNGCGKSTLFSIITGQLKLDGGEFLAQNQIRISTLSQELPTTNQTALDYVISGDKEFLYWQQQLDVATETNNTELIVKAHEHLYHLDAYSKPSIAASILAGLGFSFEEQSQSVTSFSGGWQMRLNLARCLMTPADLYLLDEPTNHLDLEAIVWLEKWIAQLNATVLLISHDRDFLDQTVNKILHIENQTFKLYSGNYSYFEQAKAEQLQMQQTLYTRQQEKIKHMMSFVERFKAKASKAKQAQSRMKAIQKIEVIAQAQLDSEFDFSFDSVQQLGNPLIKARSLVVGYGAPIVNDIEFEVHTGDRIGLLGLNGQGKSTFIKTLVGEVKPLGGEIIVNSKLKIGYYAQHQLEQLDLSLSPLQTIQQLNVQEKEQKIRQFLGGFQFQGDMALSSIKNFSGGEKARLVLAKLVWQKPDVLLLDEPTNHLDLDIRAAIEFALQTYEGAVILISHDRHLLKTTVNDFYLIHEGELSLFPGDLDDYHGWLLNRNSKKSKNTSNQPQAPQKNNKDLKALQNKLKRIEERMASCKEELAKIQHDLFDDALYTDEQKSKLEKLHTSQQKLQQEMMQLEDEWMQLMSDLDA
jgi:ATP-binding cassette subfamily F protein 3